MIDKLRALMSVPTKLTSSSNLTTAAGSLYIAVTTLISVSPTSIHLVTTNTNSPGSDALPKARCYIRSEFSPQYLMTNTPNLLLLVHDVISFHILLQSVLFCYDDSIVIIKENFKYTPVPGGTLLTFY